MSYFPSCTYMWLISSMGYFASTQPPQLKWIRVEFSNTLLALEGFQNCTHIAFGFKFPSGEQQAQFYLRNLGIGHGNLFSRERGVTCIPTRYPGCCRESKLNSAAAVDGLLQATMKIDM